MQIHKCVKKSESFATLDFKSLRKPLYELIDLLTLRTHIVGHALRIADLAALVILAATALPSPQSRRPRTLPLDGTTTSYFKP